MKDELKRIGDEFWSFTLESSPTNATLLGYHDYDAELEDLSRRSRTSTSPPSTGSPPQQRPSTPTRSPQTSGSASGSVPMPTMHRLIDDWVAAQ